MRVFWFTFSCFELSVNTYRWAWCCLGICHQSFWPSSQTNQPGTIVHRVASGLQWGNKYCWCKMWAACHPKVHLSGARSCWWCGEFRGGVWAQLWHQPPNFPQRQLCAGQPPGKISCTIGCSFLVFQALEVAKRELQFLLVCKLLLWGLCVN